MNLALFRRSAARANFDPGAGLYSDQMLAELLVLHEEMIAQLRLERLRTTASPDFLTDMIAQHEKAAELLRAQLECRGVGPGQHRESSRVPAARAMD